MFRGNKGKCWSVRGRSCKFLIGGQVPRSEKEGTGQEILGVGN